MSVETVVGWTFISELHVEWNVDNFSPVYGRSNDIRSSEFQFAGATWYLNMRQRVITTEEGISFLPDIYLYLTRSDTGCSKIVAYQFLWKTTNGRVEATSESTHDFKKDEYNSPLQLTQLLTLLGKKSEIFPSGVLTIICTLKYSGSSVGGVPVPDTDENQWIGTRTEASTQTETITCVTVPAKHENQSTVIEAFTQTEADVCIGKLQQQLKELLLDGKHSDVVLSMKGKEFAVHRNILAARSTVFSAMMEHEMKEKTSGVVVIEDSDPETFPDFLHYLYTGRVDCMSPEKALNLYVTADKYQVDELKRVCLEDMVNNITVENFCDVLSLSLRHREKELTDAASVFFVQNTMAIALTSKWQVFLGENPVAGNELLLKLVREKLQ